MVAAVWPPSSSWYFVNSIVAAVSWPCGLSPPGGGSSIVAAVCSPASPWYFVNSIVASVSLPAGAGLGAALRIGALRGGAFGASALAGGGGAACVGSSIVPMMSSAVIAPGNTTRSPHFWQMPLGGAAGYSLLQPAHFSMNSPNRS